MVGLGVGTSQPGQRVDCLSLDRARGSRARDQLETKSACQHPSPPPLPPMTRRAEGLARGSRGLALRALEGSRRL